MEEDMDNQHTIRIDRFVVPAAARAEFIALIEGMHVVIGAQRGCVQNRIFSTNESDGFFKVVTLVEWDGSESLIRAKRALMAHHRAIGFDGPSFLARIGASVERDEFSSIRLPAENCGLVDPNLASTQRTA